jgi:hypothetical protein
MYQWSILGSLQLHSTTPERIHSSYKGTSTFVGFTSHNRFAGEWR